MPRVAAVARAAATRHILSCWQSRAQRRVLRFCTAAAANVPRVGAGTVRAARVACLRCYPASAWRSRCGALLPEVLAPAFLQLFARLSALAV